MCWGLDLSQELDICSNRLRTGLAQWTSDYKILPRYLKKDCIVRWMITLLMPLRKK
ncbi:hypothetical protein KC19_1G228300 [Ceratodon purpureus]|uniref:Uncharacterized protein n=1 Tax=Ceratodon purpureus TaxID=3225 RepID=A0A8T0JBC3_CERPU|nr:hypothetical protein KC19_1G228300 [Ceratodon purpureus]